MSLPLSIHLSAMPDSIDYDCFAFNFKQNSVIANAQAILGGEIRETLDISLQIMAHLFYPCKNRGLHSGGQGLNVPCCPWFELNVIFDWLSAHLFSRMLTPGFSGTQPRARPDALGISRIVGICIAVIDERMRTISLVDER